MDPILAFCIKHPECDVSFVGCDCDWSGIGNQVKIRVVRVVDRFPYRVARIANMIDIDDQHFDLEKVLDEMYKELVHLEERNRKRGSFDE